MHGLRSAGNVDPDASSSQSTSPPEGQSASPPEGQSTPPSPVPVDGAMLLQMMKLMMEQLIASRTASVPSPVISPVPVAAGNFANCKSRFAGDSSESVEAFIDAIETFKNCCRIPDEDALLGLPMMLDRDAATWWVGMKPSTPTWSMALEALRSSYGERRPAYRLFLEVSATRQQEGESTDLFVNRKRALFAKMPYSIPETMQLDIVYGLLSPFLRTRLSRERVDNFQELILRARHIADMDAETPTGLPEPRTKATHDIPHRSRPTSDTWERLAAGSDRTFTKTDRMGEQRPRFRPTCSFCHNRGHSVEECRKKNGTHTRTPVACYGCGAPGVMKSNCPTCKTKTGAALSTIALATFPRQIPVTHLSSVLRATKAPDPAKTPIPDPRKRVDQVRRAANCRTCNPPVTHLSSVLKATKVPAPAKTPILDWRKRPDQSRRYADQDRRAHTRYRAADLVLLPPYLNPAEEGRSATFVPVREGPFWIRETLSPTTFLMSAVNTPVDQRMSHLVGVPAPSVPRRRKGRPRRPSTFVKTTVNTLADERMPHLADVPAPVVPKRRSRRPRTKPVAQ
ncbi:uncharacterized protein LOC143912001 [Arctopsyche grandis]|uniref:uncharacterized protein LOC143912001 n=1 Tax=Arctopsyche grandis TaxID=121162 RepID=UPI00406D6A21